MFEARAHIPTARLHAPTRQIAAARARRALSIAGMVGIHLARVAIVVLGFGVMVWFAAESSQTTRTRLELDRAQHLRQPDAKQIKPFGYDIHRIHLHELMRLAEDIPRSAR